MIEDHPDTICQNCKQPIRFRFDEEGNTYWYHYESSAYKYLGSNAAVSCGFQATPAI